MKKIILLTMFSLILLNCKEKEIVKTQPAQIAPAALSLASDVYKANTSKSVVKWVGKKIILDRHEGYLKVNSATLGLKDGKVVAGNIELDMNSITVTDLKDAKSNAKLTKHLKSDDFFSVASHATSKFEIISVSNENGQDTFKGNLTIKGITKVLSFPAKVNTTGDQITVTADIKIDRTLFNVQFGSKKIFLDLAKDKIIADEFELSLNLVFNKG